RAVLKLLKRDADSSRAGVSAASQPGLAVEHPHATMPSRRAGGFTAALVGLGLIVGGAAGIVAGKRVWRAELPNPRYHEITFRRGEIRSARFASDGQTILYSAAWQGNPVEVFSARPRGRGI